MGPWGGGLKDPQPKFLRSSSDAPITSIGAPSRPRTCRLFGSIILWGCPATPIQNMGPFQRHRRYGCGLQDHLPTAPRATDNFFKLFLGHHSGSIMTDPTEGKFASEKTGAFCLSQRPLEKSDPGVTLHQSERRFRLLLTCYTARRFLRPEPVPRRKWKLPQQWP